MARRWIFAVCSCIVASGCPSAPAHPTEAPVVVDAAAVAIPADATSDDVRETSTKTSPPPVVTCDGALPAGSPTQWKNCVALSDCRLVFRNCCPPCTMAQACDVVSAGGPFASALESKICGTDTPKCPACAGALSPYLHAACRKGQCVTVDLATDDTSACNADDDCVARAPDCCGPCGPGGAYVALRKDAVSSYVAEVCGKTKCAQCKTPPVAPRAACDKSTKHCVVVP